MKTKLSLLFSLIMVVALTTSSFSQWNAPTRRIERYDMSQPTGIKNLDVVNPTGIGTQTQTDDPRALIDIGSFTGTSGNGRAPQGSRLFINTKAIYSGAEMSASGFIGAVTSVQFNYDNTTAQSVATTGNLKVFLKDTVGTATVFTTTSIDTNGTGFVKVIDGTLTLPLTPAGTSFSVNKAVGGPGTAGRHPHPYLADQHLRPHPLNCRTSMRTYVRVRGLDPACRPGFVLRVGRAA